MTLTCSAQVAPFYCSLMMKTAWKCSTLIWMRLWKRPSKCVYEPRKWSLLVTMWMWFSMKELIFRKIVQILSLQIFSPVFSSVNNLQTWSIFWIVYKSIRIRWISLFLLFRNHSNRRSGTVIVVIWILWNVCATFKMTWSPTTLCSMQSVSYLGLMTLLMILWLEMNWSQQEWIFEKFLSERVTSEKVIINGIPDSQANMVQCMLARFVVIQSVLLWSVSVKPIWRHLM